MKTLLMIILILMGTFLFSEEILVWIEAVPDTIYADDNITYSTVTVKVEDENEEPVVGVQVNFSSNIGNMIFHVNTNDEGIAESQLWDSNDVGIATITASRGGQVLTTTVTILPVVDSPEDEIEGVIQKLSNYPNPFNPSTTISFTLAKPGEVIIDIFNAKGQKIERVLNESLSSGKHNIIWNAGVGRASGIYFAKMISGKEEYLNRMILMK